MTWKELGHAGRYARVLEVYKFLKSVGTATPSSKMITGIIRSAGGDDPTIGGIARLARIVRVMDGAGQMVDVTAMIDKGVGHHPIATAVAPSADFAQNGELIQPVIVMVTGVPVAMIAVGTPVTTARRAYRRHFMAAMRRQKQG